MKFFAWAILALDLTCGTITIAWIAALATLTDTYLSDAVARFGMSWILFHLIAVALGYFPRWHELDRDTRPTCSPD